MKRIRWECPRLFYLSTSGVHGSATCNGGFDVGEATCDPNGSGAVISCVDFGHAVGPSGVLCHTGADPDIHNIPK